MKIRWPWVSRRRLDVSCAIRSAQAREFYKIIDEQRRALKEASEARADDAQAASKNIQDLRCEIYRAGKVNDELSVRLDSALRSRDAAIRDRDRLAAFIHALAREGGDAERQ